MRNLNIYKFQGDKEFIRATQNPEKYDVVQKTLMEDLQSQQAIEVCTILESQMRKSSRLGKSNINYPNIKIDKEKSMEELDIYEIANVLNEESNTSKFVETKLDVTTKEMSYNESRC